MFSVLKRGRIILYYYTYFYYKMQAVKSNNIIAICKIFILFFGVFDEEKGNFPCCTILGTQKQQSIDFYANMRYNIQWVKDNEKIYYYNTLYAVYYALCVQRRRRADR